MSAFKVAMLASGSKGNAALITMDKQNFLVDVGISCRMLTQRLQELQLTIGDIEGIFITHEHIDHVKGLATLSKKFDIPIYTSTSTWKEILAKDGKIERKNCHVFEQGMVCGQVRINSFPIPHDACDPHGYSFTCGDSKCTYLTDTGHITQAIRQAVEGTDTLILEANHDVTMLKQGSYPFVLKQRILSTRGHLSNDTAGMFLRSLAKLPESIILAHLSHENNLPSVALNTVSAILEQEGLLEKTKIKVASQNMIVKNF